MYFYLQFENLKIGFILIKGGLFKLKIKVENCILYIGKRCWDYIGIYNYIIIVLVFN